MALHSRGFVAALVSAVALIGASFSAGAETFTKETDKLLKDLKLDPEVLADLDKELDVPKAWVEGATKEGMVRMRLTMDAKAFSSVWKVFAARYPGIEYEYVRGIGRERAVVPLMAFKKGTYVSDVVSSYEVMEQDFREANALEVIRPLPSFKNVPEELTTADGTGASYRLQHWCISYNTKKLTKTDMPKTWNDLVRDPKYRNGRAGMAGNLHLWLPPLWGVYGDKWLDEYMPALFHDLKPQLRKERLSMTSQLAALGEFDLTFPAPDFLVRTLEDKGMNVSLHCPDVVPSTTAFLGILRGNPHPNAARLFANWLLSKEGQIANYRADAFIPVHKDLRRKEFMPYPEETAGKRIASNVAVVRNKTPEIVAEWRKLWMSASGADSGAD